MHIEKLVVKNFKKFREAEFGFNSDTNIVVGDNDSGKSTLLEAIEICLNCTFHGRPLAGELTAEFFNNDSVKEFLALDDDAKTADRLPSILIEVYLSDAPPELRGINNSAGENTTGIFVEIKFNPDLEAAYGQLLAGNKINSLPVEFYLVDWFDFAWGKLNKFTKPAKNIFVEPDRIHPTFGKNKYINNILNESLDGAARSTLNFAYRQIKTQFDNDDDVKAINDGLDTDHRITSKDLQITTDVKSNATWENNLHLAVDDVPFAHIGKGEQSQIQIKLSLHNNANEVDVVLIEEPENHLSHINLVRLIDYVERFHGGKQLFLTTHNSYVLNKLSMGKLCLIGDGYTRLTDLDRDTNKRIKRLPGYDTLRIVLAQKAILVEGPSDELIVKKLFKDVHDKLPEEMGIEVIVVSGLGFKNYLNIAKIIGTRTLVIRDNDGDYQTNVENWFKDYQDSAHLTVSAPTDN
ncbi:ATP-dependent nuclease [Sneathiella sp. HT1-7]|uniref:ATP-dependent nuclease n=1 Tax=Sneathiella sp. HT1-7 TaxID=2887192 RepID=UPI001D151845|nr:AAA family ATPase [Sneathiella sp. HT1-7]MCC3306803.1 AAA family ATPase [Sneathiella sp. HT1-7]